MQETKININQKKTTEEEIERLKKEINEIKLQMESNRRAAIDLFEELKSMREVDTITGWFTEIREDVEKYEEQIHKLRFAVDKIVTNISTEDLNLLREKSGITLKEIAVYLGFDPVNLSAISNLINGKTKDFSKRLMAYNYMLMRIHEKANVPNNLNEKAKVSKN